MNAKLFIVRSALLVLAFSALVTDDVSCQFFTKSSKYIPRMGRRSAPTVANLDRQNNLRRIIIDSLVDQFGPNLAEAFQPEQGQSTVHGQRLQDMQQQQDLAALFEAADLYNDASQQQQQKQLLALDYTNSLLSKQQRQQLSNLRNLAATWNNRMRQAQLSNDGGNSNLNSNSNLNQSGNVNTAAPNAFAK